MYDFLTNAVKTQYCVIRMLKEGQRGWVELLRHNESGERFVFRSFEGSAEVYKKLLSVDCPNLPRVYEAAGKDGRCAVLEEYIQGDSLDFLLRDSLCTPAETRDISLQLCRGLWVLHSLGAVHRDIKPENIILRGDEAVLIDFDASRLHKQGPDSDTRVLGTTGYAAPEQYGFSQTDQRADIYSLGVVMNVMLTGQHPSRALAGGRLGRIIEKCTMTSPSRRYKNIARLMEEL